MGLACWNPQGSVLVTAMIGSHQTREKKSDWPATFDGRLFLVTISSRWSTGVSLWYYYYPDIEPGMKRREMESSELDHTKQAVRDEEPGQ
jgi:hypothetical protein